MITLLLIVIYLSFISLGLPDSLLGSIWPIAHTDLQVPLSYSGIVFMIISLGTVVSSLQSDRLTKKLGAGVVTAVSVAMTALALFGFGISTNFILMCLWAIPYGLGAGSVDAALNNYVALHFKSHHMSWLHCMWGVGASVGPYIMSSVITGGGTWKSGYRLISLLQIILTAIILLSLPLWKKAGTNENETDAAASTEVIPLKKVLVLPGAKEVMICFFCYCALEQTVGLWASSYLINARGINEVTAAKFASLFYIGITLGRAVSGFITFVLNDMKMIRLGQCLVLIGILAVIFAPADGIALAGFIIIGLGCAPIYPSIIHSTPAHFGADKSQAVIGVQMASAYIGNVVMPPLFGFLARAISVSALPYYLLIILVLMVIMHELLCKATA